MLRDGSDKNHRNKMQHLSKGTNTHNPTYIPTTVITKGTMHEQYTYMERKRKRGERKRKGCRPKKGALTKIHDSLNDFEDL